MLSRDTDEGYGRIAFDKTRLEWSDLSYAPRAVLVGLVVLGLGLVAAPAIFQMWSRAPKGAVMSDTGERLFSFPDPVNEVSARLVATGVVILALAIIAFDLPWLTLLLAYGFIARVLTGPKLSPLGLLVTKVIVPRLPIAPRLVPGPPKRFAQAIGVVFSVTAAVLALAFDQTGAAYVVLGLLVVAASLEAFVGLCLGCQIFRLLMKTGIIPEAVCERCVDLWGDKRVPQDTQDAPDRQDTQTPVATRS